MKQLISFLLSSLIEGAKAGIDNGVEDRNLDYVSDQFDILEQALVWLIQLENGEDIDFGSFGKYIKRSANTNDLESAIIRLLTYYEDIERTNNPEDRVEIRIDEELIAQLIRRIENDN